MHNKLRLKDWWLIDLRRNDVAIEDAQLDFADQIDYRQKDIEPN